MSGRSWLYGEVLNLPATGDSETEATKAHNPGLHGGLQIADRFVGPSLAS